MALTTLLCTGAAAHDKILIEDPHRMVPEIQDLSNAVALGDVDGDGDLDAVIGNQLYTFGQNLLCLNDGSGAFSDATDQLPRDSDDTQAVALGDLDGDGDIDILFGNRGGQNRLYLNDGTGVFNDATNRLPQGDDYTNDVALGDVDGDGDLDAVIATAAADFTRLYVNNGNAFFTVASGSLPQYNANTMAIDLGDVDGDGDLDILAGNGCWGPDSHNYLYLNDGSGYFTIAAGHIPPHTEDTREVVLGDMDGDGDLDAVIGNGSAGQDRLYFNDGNGFFSDATAQFPQDGCLPWGSALGDVDGDGDLDVCFVCGGRRALYLNDGAGVFVDATNQLPSEKTFDRQVALGDVDGDGDLDAFIATSYQDWDARNRLYLNNGAGYFSGDFEGALPSLPPDEYLARTIAVGDVDGDGDLDTIMGTGDQDRLYINDGTGVLVDGTDQLPADPDRTYSVALGDVDGDGDLDAVVGKYGQDRLHLNDGTGVFSDASGQIPAHPEGTYEVALGDVDGDGDLDIMKAGCPDHLYLNDGSGFFSDATAQIPTAFSGCVELGDVDGDGDLDAFLGDYGQNRLYLNDGTGRFADASGWLPVNTAWTIAVALVDFDGDGDLDALDVRNNAKNAIYRNDGTGLFTEVPTPFISHYTMAVAIGDMDLDGDLDILFGNSYVPRRKCLDRLYLNDGSGKFTKATATMIPMRTVDTPSLALGDMDGDGDLDAIIGSTSRDPGLIYTNTTRQLYWRGVPRIGKPLTMELHGPPGGWWRLAASRSTARIPKPPFGTLAIDPAGVFHQRVGTFDNEGRALATYQVPSLPWIVGASLHWQALIGPPARLSNYEITTFTDL